jgi:hypothetical protein
MPGHGDGILVEEMLDIILTDTTHRSYLNDNINLMKWCEENKPDWVTEFGTVQFARLHEGDEEGRSFKEENYPMSGTTIFVGDHVPRQTRAAA